MKKLLLIMLGVVSFEALGSSLHDACKGYDPLVVRKAIISGAQLNELNSANQTPLLYVCTFNFCYKLAINYAEQLLRAGAHVNCQDSNGNTALHIACKHLNNHLVFLLLDYGANLHIKNNNGFTALHIAVKHNLEVVEYLFGFGANIHVRDNKGRTPLHIASEHGNASIVKFLLEHGADAYVLDNNGYTAIDICCKKNEKAVQEEKLKILYLLQNHR